MFTRFFHELRAGDVPVSLREYLTLLEALDADIINRRAEEFYYLSRAALVKDERKLDKFDQVFARVFKGLETLTLDTITEAVPDAWLRALTEKYLTEEEKAQIEAQGGWDKLMETLRQRLEEQKERHQGGSKWIGTGGTSPYGNSGYNPEGVRIGGKGGQNKAVKVWEKREFRNLDDEVELGVRNMRLALRRLRRFAREGAAEELDLPGTIATTARKGWLDIQLRPERRNRIKTLLFLDVGGSMDPHVRACAELFSAAKTEFKRLESFYFHNCVYESVWKNNRRRHSERTQTSDILHSYSSDHKVVIVGDASMSPYELAYPGGSVEHWNDEPGAQWLQRIVDVYPGLAWLNPLHARHWEHTPSVRMVRDIIGEDRMYPLTLGGVDNAMRALARDH